MVPTAGVTSNVTSIATKTAILSGPTATGKSGIAFEFAREERARGVSLEIINADSLLVYRRMNIGTAKPSEHELREIPHHLIDILDPGETFTAGDFFKRAIDTLDTLEREGRRGIIVGGSGFYLKALLYGLWEGAPSEPAVKAEIERMSSEELYSALYAADSQSALRIGVNDRYRLVRAHELIRLIGKTPSELRMEHDRTPNTRFAFLVIDRSTQELHQRVARRTREMLEQGLVDEVREIRERFSDSRALGAVGYEQTSQYLDGVAPPGRKSKPGIDGLADEIDLATRQLIKRQRTWFKSEKNAERFELERDREKLFERLREIYR